MSMMVDLFYLFLQIWSHERFLRFGGIIKHALDGFLSGEEMGVCIALWGGTGFTRLRNGYDFSNGMESKNSIINHTQINIQSVSINPNKAKFELSQNHRSQLQLLTITYF
jgi:hypothetical protein